MSAKSFFSKLLNQDMDSVICRLIDMPKGVYDELPGDAGSKFLTEEQYAILKARGITSFDLSKRIHSGMYSTRKTLVFDEDFLTTISCEKNLVNKDSYRPMVSVVIGGYEDNQMGWENFEIEYGRDERYSMCSYKGARVRTSLDEDAVRTSLQNLMENNGVVKGHNPFKTIMSDTKTRFSYDHVEIPNGTKTHVICNSRMFNVGKTLPELVVDATISGNKLFDQAFSAMGIDLTNEDENSIV